MSDVEEQPFDAGDPVSVKRRRRDLGLAAREQGHALSAAMASSGGRAWMYDILVRCHIFTTSFHSNALSMAFMEGERNVGLKLVADIHAHCPDRYNEMMQEASNVRPDRPDRNNRNGNNARRSNGDDSGNASGDDS